MRQPLESLDAELGSSRVGTRARAAAAARTTPWPALFAGVLVLALIAACVFWWPAIADIDAQRLRFSTWHAAHPIAFPLYYFAVFVLITALCLPGASVLMLAGGASFGFAFGTALSTAASALGALATMAVARRLLRPHAERRHGDRLQAFERDVRERGVAYLFSLRVLPLMPFTVVNVLAGLTSMRPWTFLWVSALGMAPGTAVYVYAGVRLGQVRTPLDLFTPEILTAFALLAAVPWMLRWLVARYRRPAGGESP